MGSGATFKDWATECTNCPTEVSELALGHSVGTKVEAAYRRRDLFEKRRGLMQAWATYCAGVTELELDPSSSEPHARERIAI